MKRTPFTVRLATWLAALSVTAAVISCSQLKKVGPGRAAGLSYRWEVGKALQYAVTTHTDQSMEAMGQTVKTTMDSRMILTFTPQKVHKDGSSEVAIRIDSIRVKANSPMGPMTPDLSALAGKEAVFLIDPSGKILKTISGAERLKFKLGPGSEMDLSGNFGRLLVRVPNRICNVGETWSLQDTTRTKQSGMEIHVLVNAKYSATGREPSLGIPCLKVHGESSLSMEGSGQNPMAGEMSFEGDGQSKIDYWFDTARGRLVQSKYRIETEGTVAVAGQQSMTMPMEMVTTADLTLLNP